MWPNQCFITRKKEVWNSSTSSTRLSHFSQKSWEEPGDKATRNTVIQWHKLIKVVGKCSCMLENDHFQFEGNKQPDSSKLLSDSKCCVYRLRMPSFACVPEIRQRAQVAKEQYN